MKFMKIIIASLLVFSVSSFAEPAKQATIDELFKVSEVEKLMDSVYGQMDGMLKQMIQGMNVPEDKKPAMDKFIAKYNVVIREEMSWEKLKGPMGDAYAKVYTDGELKDIIKFYKSAAGQKMLKKMPELMQATMVMVQDMMRSTMPKIQALQKELQDDLAAKPVEAPAGKTAETPAAKPVEKK